MASEVTHHVPNNGEGFLPAEVRHAVDPVQPAARAAGRGQGEINPAAYRRASLRTAYISCTYSQN